MGIRVLPNGEMVYDPDVADDALVEVASDEAESDEVIDDAAPDEQVDALLPPEPSPPDEPLEPIVAGYAERIENGLTIYEPVFAMMPVDLEQPQQDILVV